jgi:hypothetical protein
MAYRPEQTQLIHHENIAGFLSESGLEVCRLSSKVQVVKHIKNSFNARVTSFCFDPHGKKLVYFLSNKKFLVLDLKEEGDLAINIFKDVKDDVVFMKWQNLGVEMDYNANPFNLPIYEDDFTPDLTKKLPHVK